jgi:hypothetical protein
MLYLQTGFKFRLGSIESGSNYDNELRRIRHQLVEYQTASEENLADLRTQLLDKVGSSSEERASSVEVLSEEDRQDLVESTARKVHSEAAEKVLADLREQVAATDIRDAAISHSTNRFNSTIIRLRDELSALSRRGNLNLVLGILTTVAGLFVLGYFVVKIPSDGDPTTGMLIRFVPRLSLVVFIEVFAYFFLRLYKASLAEIKYFQNELTNVEAKAIALETSAALGSNAIVAVIQRIASTERNNVLDKGQTTVELEQARIQDERLSTLMKDYLPSIKQQGQAGG